MGVGRSRRARPGEPSSLTREPVHDLRTAAVPMGGSATRVAAAAQVAMAVQPGQRLAVTVAVAVAVAVAVLAGCGGASNSDPGGTVARAPDVSTPTARHDPAALVGFWSMSGPGVPAGTKLGLGMELTVWLPCGVMFGDWRANRQGAFLGELHSVSGKCLGRDARAATSLIHEVTRFQPTDDGLTLQDVAGDSTARLEPLPEGPPFLSARPSVAAGERADLKKLRARLRATPDPLSAGLRPANAPSLIGSWALQPRSRAYITLRRDGTYVGSDGCNRSEGRWRVGVDGALLATSGPITLVACDNLDVPGFFSSAARAGFDGDSLVLTHADSRTPPHRLVRLNGPGSHRDSACWEPAACSGRD